MGRVTIPHPNSGNVEAFKRRLNEARRLGRGMGQELSLKRGGGTDPINLVLSETEHVLTKRGQASKKSPEQRCISKGERFALAAVILHQSLLEFEVVTSSAEEIGWIRRGRTQERLRALRGPFWTMIQNLLTQAWARLPIELRKEIFDAFGRRESEETVILWRRICRGSLSVAYTARGFQGIRLPKRRRKRLRKTTCASSTALCTNTAEEIGSLCALVQNSAPTLTKELCSSPKPLKTASKNKKRYWEVFAPTDGQDRHGKIDLIVRGHIRGFGKIIICIQIKTGKDPYLEVLTTRESTGAETSVISNDTRDALWEGVERFAHQHPQIAKSKTRLYPAVIHTGSAAVGVTHMAPNTVALRALIEEMLKKLRKELRLQKKRERTRREIEEPGLRRRKAIPKT